MTMESPADPGVQSQGSTNGSPADHSGETAPILQTLQSLPACTAQQLAQQQQTYVMAPNSSSDGTNTMMQPPASVPVMMSPYQMLVPTQGLTLDQHGQLIQQQAGSSPAGSRSTTPQQQATALYQQQIIQLKDSAVKSDPDSRASPARQGSVGSGGSPAPPTPGSLGSPIPQLMSDGMPPPSPHQIQFQGQMPMELPLGLSVAHQQAASTPPPAVKEEEKVDISKLKPPKKPLTPYMRFSKSIWQQVKAANPSMSVCEIGATIGRMWRELADTEKQKYNEEFANDKIRYDGDLQAYLKLTGLQASDLVKARTKKKGSGGSHESKSKAKQQQHSHPSPSPQQQQQQQQQHHQQQLAQGAVVQQMAGGQQVMLQHGINGPVTLQSGPGGAAGLPQQVLSGTALSNLPHFSQVWTGQQGATLLSQGGQATGQEQVIVQQGAHGQQVLINTLGLPPGTVVNGSTATGDNANMLSAGAPILIQPTGEQATQLFSTEGQPGQEGQKVEGEQPVSSQAAGTPQLTTLGWHQINPGDLQQQQNMLNLLNMAAAQSGVQPDQLTQAAQIAGLPLGVQQVNMAAAQHPAGQPQPGESDSMETSTSAAATTRAETTLLLDQNGVPIVQTAADGSTTAATHEGIQVVYNRESILETELQHLRSALSEKTKEVQKLTQDLEKAYSIIEQLKQQNPTAVIHLPAPLEGQVVDGGAGTPQPVTSTPS